MKLSISNIGWLPEHDDRVLSHMASRGFLGLEIAPTRIIADRPYDHLGQARTWAGSLRRRYSLSVSSMQSIWYGRRERLFGSAEERQALLDYTRRAIDFAAATGCRNLVFGSPKNRDTDDVEAAMPIAVEFFHKLGEYAAARGTVLAMEANPPIYGTRFINTTPQAVELVRRVASRGFRVNLDLGTMLQGGEPIDSISQFADIINHVHISEPHLAPILHRKEHLQLFQVLAEGGYRGFVSIETGGRQSIDSILSTIDYVADSAQTF